MACLYLLYIIDGALRINPRPELKLTEIYYFRHRTDAWQVATYSNVIKQNEVNVVYVTQFTVRRISEIKFSFHV